MSFLVVFLTASTALAQSSPAPWAPTDSSSSVGRSPVTFTADEDHQNMMDQLGIKALRPGPSGNEKAPNHANYDEVKANPFPDIPDPLTMNSGQKVITPKLWWDE